MRINMNPANYYSNVGQMNNQQSISANEGVITVSTEKASMPSTQIRTDFEKGNNSSDLAQKPKHELTIDEKAWLEMIEKANKAIAGSYCNFEYSIHEQTKQIMVKVIDRDTKEVIREIPPEKVLDMVAYMWELAGIIVDERR